MNGYTVALVDVGENLPLDIHRLVKRLNSLQKSFHFVQRGVITASVLGQPDIEDEWYDVAKVLQIIAAKTDTNGFDLVIGITKVKISNQADVGAKPEKNYFSLSDLQRISIISAHPKVLKYHSEKKGIDRYISFLAICELLINLSHANLSHFGEEPCLFNECEDRATLCDCISKGHICADCITQLKKANVSNSILQDAKKVLHWCRRNSWGYAARNTLSHPVPSLGFGTGLGWLCSVFLTQKYYPIIIGATLLPGLAVFLISRFSRKYS